ncbi:hypothetical protein AgCh_006522 [Apium graveolens]
MTDLEKLLLEAAGRTGRSGRKWKSPPSSRRQREGSYSDNGSDSGDNDSDDDRSRYADREAAKGDALNELRAKRLRQHDLEAHLKHKDSTSVGSGSHRFSPVKQRSYTEVAPAVPTFGDIKEITIQRSKLAKRHMEPFFDDLIVGCVVRVGVAKSRNGPRYSIGVVKNVDSTNPERQYKLENMITHKYLNIILGHENSAQKWAMVMMSDSLPFETEFKEWVKDAERSGGRMPSKQDVLDKKDAIQKTSTYVYSAATMKQMLQEKKPATCRPLNVAAEKDRLRREMDVAISKSDEAEVERINARLLELEASRNTQEKDHKAINLEKMNRKNRVDNFRNASGIKSASGLKAGDAGYDPFSRRWTRSRNYYVLKASAGDEAAVGGNCEQTAALVGPDGSGAVGTAAALVAAAEAGKLVDTSAPLDQGTESNLLHKFELPISLAILKNFGGVQGAQVGFLARKQRVEATVGCRVPENDGRRHPQTLTISYYKRRRGLL